MYRHRVARASPRILPIYARWPWGVSGGWTGVREEHLGSRFLHPWLAVSSWALLAGVGCVISIFLAPVVLKFSVRVLSGLCRRSLFPSLFARDGGPPRAKRVLDAMSTVAVVGLSLLVAWFSGRGAWRASLFDRAATCYSKKRRCPPDKPPPPSPSTPCGSATISAACCASWRRRCPDAPCPSAFQRACLTPHRGDGFPGRSE